jgi:hypothetical protein
LTLAGIETAGIPVEDQLLEAGGRHKRAVLQWSQEWGASTFIKLRADHLRLTNPGTIGADLRTPSLPFLEELRNAQLTNLSSTDLLEDTPSYEGGTRCWQAASTTCSAASGRATPSTCTSTATVRR